LGKAHIGEGPHTDTVLYLGYDLKGTTSVQKKRHMYAHLRVFLGFNILALALQYFHWNFDNCHFYENGL